MAGTATQVWMPKAVLGRRRISALVRSEWVTPLPAIIQFTSPGYTIWSAPVLSRWWNAPS